MASTRVAASAASADAWRTVAVAAAGAAAAAALLVGALALYQRFGRPRALDHPARAALHDALGARVAPAGVGDLARVTGLTPKTAEYHLLYLARLGIVREVRPPHGPRAFALPGRVPADALSPEVAFEARILEEIRLAPGTTAAALARVLGVTRPRVERRVKDLLLAGRLDARVDAGARRLYVPASPNGNG